MIEALTALVVTLVIFLLMAVAYLGWGRAASRLISIAQPTSASPMLLIWLGWAFSLWILQVVHLFLPITVYVVIAVYGLGLIFSIQPIWHAVRSLKKSNFGFWIIFLISILLVAVWVSLRAMLPATNYDTGLYHFNAIRWINTFPIVPGLGNLHERLAFNQAFFTWVAALNFYPWFGHGSSLANSFLLLLSFASFLYFLRPVLHRPALLIEAHPFLYASALWVIPILGYLSIISRELSSPTPDLASSLLQLNMFVMLARGIAQWGSEERWMKAESAVVMFLAATAVTIKLSNLAVSAVLIGFCLIYAWRVSKTRIKDLLVSLAPALAVILVWGFRGVMLSGAPFFPATIGYLPVDWAMPFNNVVGQANSIYSWARQPHALNVLGNWNWLGPWLIVAGQDSAGVVYPFISAFVFGGLALMAAVYALLKRRGPLRWLYWSILLLPLLGLVFWFFTAPDLRFANSLFWLLSHSAALLLLCCLQPLLSRRGFAITLCIVFIAANFLLVKYSVGRYSFKEVSTSGWQPETTFPLIQKQTLSGSLIYTPDHGELCWDSPLPCTPDFNANLRLRVPGDLGAGFTVEQPK